MKERGQEFLDDLTRRDAMLGLGGLGLGTLGFGAGAAARNLYGGDADNTTGPDSSTSGNFGSGDVGNNENDDDESSGSSSSVDNSQDNNGQDDNQEPDQDFNDEDNTDDSGEDESFGTDNPDSYSNLDVETSYMLEDDVEIDLSDLDSVYESSAVVLGVQENGNLVAWNTEVEDEDGYSPLWRFKGENFPNRDYFSIDGDHPVEELYEGLDVELDSMAEEMVMTFYSSDEDEGSWEDHQDYKELSFEELKNGLIEYSSPGHAQDYFLNRDETLERGEATLETEWQQLLQDGL